MLLLSGRRYQHSLLADYITFIMAENDDADDVGVLSSPLEPRQYPDRINIIHKAKFASICCDSYNEEKSRKYFMILENSYESNYPIGCACYPCFSSPPNICCPGMENVIKTHFDRGIFSRHTLCWNIKFYEGGTGFFSVNESKLVCCMIDCPEVVNRSLFCKYSRYFGDSVYFIPSQIWCWFCPTRANALHNCCGLCGVKDHEPLPLPCVKFPFAHHLLPSAQRDECERLIQAVIAAREEWETTRGGDRGSGGGAGKRQGLRDMGVKEQSKKESSSQSPSRSGEQSNNDDSPKTIIEYTISPMNNCRV